MVILNQPFRLERSWDAACISWLPRQPRQHTDKYGDLSIVRYIDRETANSACFDMCRRIKRHKTELAQRIRALVPSLDPQQARVIHLLYFSGYSIGKTARRMVLSQTEVVNLRDSAIKALKKILYGRGPGYERSPDKK